MFVITSYDNSSKAAPVRLNGHVINRRRAKGRIRCLPLSAASFTLKLAEEDEHNVHQVRFTAVSVLPAPLFFRASGFVR